MGIGPLGRIDFVLPVDVPQTNKAPTPTADLVGAVRELNRSEFASTDRQLTFSWDASTNRPVIKIVKKDTGEVVEEIPPEQVRQMIASIANERKKNA